MFAVGDPQGIRGYFGQFVAAFFTVTSTPFGVATSLLILFHWNRAIHSFGAKSIDWMMRPIIGLIIFSVVGEVVSATIRALEFGPVAFILLQIVFTILQFFVVGYIIYTTKNLYSILAQEKNLSSSQRPFEPPFF